MIQARYRLGFNLFKLELKTEAGVAVKCGSSRVQACQECIRTGKRSTRHGVDYQEFFLNAESAHGSILRALPTLQQVRSPGSGPGLTPAGERRPGAPRVREGRGQSWKYSIFAPMVLSRSARSS